MFIKILSTIVFFIAVVYSSIAHAGGTYQKQIDMLQAKFSSVMKKENTNISEKKISALILSAEALSLCAHIEQIPQTKELLSKRTEQFHKTVSQSKTDDEKILNSSVGVYNFMLMIASIHSILTQINKAVRDIDQQTIQIGKSDSLDTITKSALILTQAFKICTISALTVDSTKKCKEEMQKIGKRLEAEGRKISEPLGGIAIAGYQTARMFMLYSRLRFPQLKKQFGTIERGLKATKKSFDEQIIIGYSALFRAVITHARHLDQK